MDDEEWNDSTLGDYLWTAGNGREAIPGVMTPASWSVLRRYIGESLGPRLQYGHPLFGNIAGRFYMNLSLTKTQADLFGFGGAIDVLTDHTVGPVPDDMEIPAVPISRWQVLRAAGFRDIRYNWWAVLNWRRLDRQLDRLHDSHRQARTLVAGAEERETLLSAWWERVSVLFDDTCRLIRITRPAMIRMIISHQLLCRLIGEADTAEVTSGSGAHGELASLDLLIGARDVRDGQLSTEEYAFEYGHRGSCEHELSIPRLGEDPDWIREQIDENTTARSVDELLAERRRRRTLVWERLERAGAIRCALAKRAARSWAEAARMRERSRSEGTRMFWLLRDFCRRAGDITGLGDDVFMLELDEILAALDGNTTPFDHISARRATYERYKAAADPPLLIRGTFDIDAWSAANEGGPRPHISDERVLQGVPGVAGTVEGRARILNSPSDASEFQSSEILVCQLTNVGWTPLFLQAAAVVTDVGASMSHAAIIARELGIPAVVGTNSATRTICTGDLLRVDGATGTVTVLERSPASTGN